MAFIDIPISEEERKAVAKAINEHMLARHITYMSRSSLAKTACVKDSKLRVILQDMVDNGLVIQYVLTENPHRQRYMFVLTDTGKALLK